MDANSTLNYRLYLQRQEEFVRADYHMEFKQYNRIRTGDVEGTKARFKIARQNFEEGRGVLSDNPLRSLIYHLVVSAGIISRVCIEGGMELDTAYTLSDIYIRRADKAKSREEVLDIMAEMQIDYATRMRDDVKKQDANSLHVKRSIEYIYDNLHRQISVSELAVREGLSTGYFSRLFAKETGVSVNQFINDTKIRTAQNILKYSDFSILNISLSLGFSSQSAFSAVFKKVTGLSPKAYRDQHYNRKDIYDWHGIKE
ncbi:MAG: helix-turn-helix transcriptional regulator [Eubacterium sp.]|nr:helix-turn-helix transcriptional regulator [Eubacterium sp.]